MGRGHDRLVKPAHGKRRSYRRWKKPVWRRSVMRARVIVCNRARRTYRARGPRRADHREHDRPRRPSVIERALYPRVAFGVAIVSWSGASAAFVRAAGRVGNHMPRHEHRDKSSSTPHFSTSRRRQPGSPRQRDGCRATSGAGSKPSSRAKDASLQAPRASSATNHPAHLERHREVSRAVPGRHLTARTPGEGEAPLPAVPDRLQHLAARSPRESTEFRPPFVPIVRGPSPRTPPRDPRPPDEPECASWSCAARHRLSVSVSRARTADDADRPLTAEGRRKNGASGSRLKSSSPSFDLLPLALQTRRVDHREIVAGAYGGLTLERVPELAPGVERAACSSWPHRDGHAPAAAVGCRATTPISAPPGVHLLANTTGPFLELRRRAPACSSSSPVPSATAAPRPTGSIAQAPPPDADGR